MTSGTLPANDLRRFTYRKTFIVGFGFLGISIIWPIFNQFIPIFLQAGNPEFERQLLEAGREIPQVIGFGLTPALALFIMTWDNLINVFFQPWVGAKSDSTWTRIGRRKPWIIIGVPIAVIGFVMIPFAQTALAIAVFILITNFGMALFRSPTVSWLGDLFMSDDRSKANGIINLMGGAGALIAYFGGGYLFNNFGRAAPFIGGALLLVAAVVVALVGVKEPEQLESEQQPADEGVLSNLRVAWHNPDKSGLYVLLGILLWFMAYNTLDAGLSSFAVFSLGIAPGTASILAGAGPVTFILAALPAGFLGTKYGREAIIRLGLIALTVIFLASYFLIQDPVTLVIALVLTGVFWAFVNVNSLPLVYDHGDERRIGAYTGLYYFSSQLAAVLGPTMGGVMVDLLGDQYRWLFIYGTIFMFLALLALTHVKPRPSIQEISP